MPEPWRDPGIVGRNDLILADRFSHACTRDGARLSGANVMRFAHNRVEHCQELSNSTGPDSTGA